MDIVLAGGAESISTVQTQGLRIDMDPQLVAMQNDMFMPMIVT
jgi:acetyl-CoA C-acetyltransferase